MRTHPGNTGNTGNVLDVCLCESPQGGVERASHKEEGQSRPRRGRHRPAQQTTPKAQHRLLVARPLPMGVVGEGIVGRSHRELSRPFRAGGAGADE